MVWTAASRSVTGMPSESYTAGTIFTDGDVLWAMASVVAVPPPEGGIRTVCSGIGGAGEPCEEAQAVSRITDRERTRGIMTPRGGGAETIPVRPSRVQNRIEESNPRRFLRYHAHRVVHHLEETTLHAKPLLRSAPAEPQFALPKQRHHRRMPGENPHLSIERRSDNRFRRPLEQHGFRRD